MTLLGADVFFNWTKPGDLIAQVAAKYTHPPPHTHSFNEQWQTKPINFMTQYSQKIMQKYNCFPHSYVCVCVYGVCSMHTPYRQQNVTDSKILSHTCTASLTATTAREESYRRNAMSQNITY